MADKPLADSLGCRPKGVGRGPGGSPCCHCVDRPGGPSRHPQPLSKASCLCLDIGRRTRLNRFARDECERPRSPSWPKQIPEAQSEWSAVKRQAKLVAEALIRQLPEHRAERPSDLLRDPRIDPVMDLGAIAETLKNCRFHRTVWMLDRFSPMEWMKRFAPRDPPGPSSLSAETEMANAVQSLRSPPVSGLPKVAHLSLTQMRRLLSGS